MNKLGVTYSFIDENREQKFYYSYAIPRKGDSVVLPGVGKREAVEVIHHPVLGGFEPPSVEIVLAKPFKTSRKL